MNEKEKDFVVAVIKPSGLVAGAGLRSSRQTSREYVKRRGSIVRSNVHEESGALN